MKIIFCIVFLLIYSSQVLGAIIECVSPNNKLYFTDDSGCPEGYIDRTPVKLEVQPNSKPACLKNDEHKYLFEASYINFAWGFKYWGLFVMTDGTVWCFDSSRNNDAMSSLRERDPEGYYCPESLDNRYKKKQLIGKVQFENLSSMHYLIKKVPEKETTRQQMGADMGASSLDAFFYAPETNKYKYINLYSRGSWDITNTSQAAATLKMSFEEILSSFPGPNKCVVKNKI